MVRGRGNEGPLLRGPGPVGCPCRGPLLSPPREEEPQRAVCREGLLPHLLLCCSLHELGDHSGGRRRAPGSGT